MQLRDLRYALKVNYLETFVAFYM